MKRKFPGSVFIFAAMMIVFALDDLSGLNGVWDWIAYLSDVVVVTITFLLIAFVAEKIMGPALAQGIELRLENRKRSHAN